MAYLAPELYGPGGILAGIGAKAGVTSSTTYQNGTKVVSEVYPVKTTYTIQPPITFPTADLKTPVQPVSVSDTSSGGSVFSGLANLFSGGGGSSYTATSGESPSGPSGAPMTQPGSAGLGMGVFLIGGAILLYLVTR